MNRTKSIIMAGCLAALLVVMVFVVTSSANARTGETAAAGPLASGLVPAVPGTFLTGPNEGDPLTIALNFIRANRAELQLSEAEVSNLVVQDIYLSQNSGITHIYLLQTHNGIEVFNSLITINIAQDGSVMNVGNRAVANLTNAVQSSIPQISAVTALEKAAENLGLTLNETPVVQSVIGGAAQAVILSDSGISQEAIPARLVYQPLADGTVRLAWELIIREITTPNWWNIRLDAVTGQELDRSNYSIKDEWGLHQGHDDSADLNVPLSGSAVPSSYLVYGMPIESPNYAVPGPPADGRTTEISPWLDAPNASPLGWHATTGTNWTNTQGNNVDSHKGATRYDCGATLECDPPIDLTMSPTTADNRDSALVNLFYWNNIDHDVSYEYGFDEAGGNFQIDNFGLGGLGNDRVNANSQLGNVCNAFFTTPPDGSPPTMDMYVCPTAVGLRDGSLDNGVISHEYAHGISNRLTGGPGNVNCLNNNEQMGEGWSDWYGLMLTIEPGDAGTDSRGIGTWLLGQPPNGPGVRPTPYSTNMAINPTTYANLPGQPIPHGVGYVWATMVWEVVWNLIDQHGYNPDFYDSWSTGGNNLALQLVIDGMKLQPCSPGFVDGRDAILLADQNLTGGLNQCLIWGGFAKRGLGFSASQGSPFSTVDGTPAFDLPPACINPPVINVSNTQMGGTINVGETLTQTLTISNAGLFNLDWIITERGGSPFAEGACSPAQALDWVDASPTNGTTSPGGSDDITVVFDGTAVGAGVYSGELCVTSNDPTNAQLVVELDLTVVSQANNFNYMPAIHGKPTANVTSTPGFLPIGGLFLVPAVVFGWRRKNQGK